MRVRQFFLACTSVTAVLGTLVALVVVVIETRSYRDDIAVGRRSAAFGILTHAVVAYALERGTVNAALQLDRPAEAPVLAKIAAQAAVTAGAFDRAAALLDQLPDPAAAGAVRATADLIAQRRRLAETALQRPRDDRAPELVTEYAPQVKAISDRLSAVTGGLEVAIRAAAPTVGELIGIARMSIDMRAAAGTRAVLFTDIVAAGAPIPPAELERLAELQGAVEEGWRNLVLQVRLNGAPARLAAALVQAQRRYLGDGGVLYARIVAAGRGDGRYPMALAPFRAEQTDFLQSISAVADAAIAEAGARADADRDRAFGNLMLANGLVLLVVAVIGLVSLLFERRVVAPLTRLTAIITQLTAGGLALDIPHQRRRDEIGDLARAMAVFKDHVQERARLEAAAVYHSELAEANRRIADGLAREKALAEAATRAKSAFLATMSHEIRTPMNGIIAVADLLQQADLPAEEREMAHLVHSSAVTLLTLLNDILDISKIEAGQFQIEVQAFSLIETVEGAADLLAARAAEAGLNLQAFVDPALADFRLGDALRLRQILVNLVGNAIKFTPTGQVLVEAVPDAGKPGWVCFAVVDTGVGIPEAQRAHLFEPFAQADASIARRYGGSGLGLSICRRLVALMGGEIGLESQVGAGSRFWFTVPLPLAEPDAPSTAVALGGIHVLRVSARRGLPSSVARYLACGDAIMTDAASPEQAEALLAQHATGGTLPDLVLVDSSLSSAQGVALIRRLHGSHALAAVKVALMMPPGTASSRQAAVAAGAFAVLHSPIRRDFFHRVVAAAAGRATLENTVMPRWAPRDAWRAPSPGDARAAAALILVAEDNRTNQAVIAKLLARLGYAAEIVANGRLALDRLQAGSGYGLLLTDCNMPELDGVSLARAVRAAPAAFASIPILALTADALPATEAECLDAGMDGCLRKPIDAARLGDAIARWMPHGASLRRPAEGSPSADASPKGDAPALDLSELLATFGGATDELRALLADFRDRTRSQVGELAARLDAGERALARDIVHGCKGAAETVGAIGLGRICADLEQRLGARDLPGALALLPDLGAELDQVADAIAAL